jgi:probable rRNA maturation factor
MSELKVDILVESPLWERKSRISRSVMRAAMAAGAHPEVGPAIQAEGEVCVTLIDDKGIAALNRRWRGKNAPTNVLSFPAPLGPVMRRPRFLGDIALAFETIDREAKTQEKPFEDHVAHLVVHGLLHLLGYDHLSEGEARRMEALETRILVSIGVADPYATEAA